MRLFTSLFSKILLWFFLNLALLSGVLIVFFSLQSQVDLRSILGRQTFDRMMMAGRMIADDLNREPKTEWPDILARHGRTHQVDFILSYESGEQVQARNMDISEAVLKTVRDAMRPKLVSGRFKFHDPPGHRIKPPPDDICPPPDQEFVRNDEHRHKSGPPRVTMRTKDPTRYWAGVPIVMFPQSPGPPPSPAMLLAVSGSMTGNGFFFDPLPWIILAAAVILTSALFWIPLVRSLTRPLARMTRAAEEIAKGGFDVQVEESRSDEIGRLGKAINHMTSRLGGFVKGQKRFLGDVAHELGSPIARIHLGLGILEQHIGPENQGRLADVVEDMAQLSNLVNELLSFSRAEMNPAKVRLETTDLLPLVRRAVQRESNPGTEVATRIDPGIRVVADPELLTRALANLIRNAVKYAAEAGPIGVSAEEKKEEVIVEVRDGGPGVPEDLMDRLFEPFFRPEPSRDRDSGGVGLGLAIVKTCIETCKGSVSARNLQPCGFAVTIKLPSGKD